MVLTRSSVAGALLLTLVLFAGAALRAQSVNTLTAAEKKQGWVLLFDGKSFEGWRQCNGTAMPANWAIDDQAMKAFTAAGRKLGEPSGGDVLYGARKFRNFELSVDWKTEKAGNVDVGARARRERAGGVRDRVARAARHRGRPERRETFDDRCRFANCIIEPSHLEGSHRSPPEFDDLIRSHPFRITAR